MVKTDTSTKETIWSAPFIILMVVNFFQSTAAFMANTTLPVFASELGASTALVGIVVSSFTLTAILIRPFAGPAFDSFSRRRLLIICQGIICLSLIFYGLVDSIPLLIAVRMLHGIGIGCSGPLAMSLVSEYLPTSKFASGISIYALAQSFAQVIGPALGLFLVDITGFSTSYFLAAACLLAAMTGIFIIKEPDRERLPYELKLYRMFAREAISAAAALMLLAISFSCMGAYVVLYGYEMGVANMGVFFTVYALCLIVTRPVFGKLADRWGAARVLLIGLIFFGASYVALYFARSMEGFIVAAVLGSAGFGTCAPLLQSLALVRTPAERRGAASNTAFTGLDFGMLFGPIIGGTTVELLNPIVGGQAMAYANMWLIMLIPALGTFLICFYWSHHSKRRK